MVIAVSSGFMADPSGVTQNTAVTFMNGGSETTIKFCGDQQHLFPIEATVRADYTAGVMCSVLVRVVVDNERTESRDTASLHYGDTSTPAYLEPSINSSWGVTTPDFSRLYSRRTFCHFCQS
jgi:hypothetical protein